MNGTRDGWRLGCEDSSTSGKRRPRQFGVRLASYLRSGIGLIKLIDGTAEQITAAEELASEVPSVIGSTATAAAAPTLASGNGSSATAEDVNEIKKEILSLKGRAISFGITKPSCYS